MINYKDVGKEIDEKKESKEVKKLREQLKQKLVGQDPLESESEWVIKETKATFKNPVMLWAGGKDSTAMLYIAKLAFFRLGKIPFPVMQLDTTYKFRETYEFMDRVVKAWNLDFIKYKNKEALKQGINPFKHDKFVCCTQLKTETLRKAILEYGFDAVFVGIRWDEHGIRGKERFFSEREDPDHVRVHPMLNWSEKNIWAYTKKNDVPYNPLYDRIEHGNLIYRSIGCYPCTKPIPKEALSERSGRTQDKEEIMEQLRALGYM